MYILSFICRYWGVYAIFYFLGITTLLPWNFFINADQVQLNKFLQIEQMSFRLENFYFYVDLLLKFLDLFCSTGCTNSEMSMNQQMKQAWKEHGMLWEMIITTLRKAELTFKLVLHLI